MLECHRMPNVNSNLPWKSEVSNLGFPDSNPAVLSLHYATGPQRVTALLCLIQYEIQQPCCKVNLDFGKACLQQFLPGESLPKF